MGQKYRRRGERRRHHRYHIIKRRQDIVRRVWGMDEDHLWLTQGGRLDKHNLQCDCWMCKHDGVSELRFTKSDRMKGKQEVRSQLKMFG